MEWQFQYVPDFYTRILLVWVRSFPEVPEILTLDSASRSCFGHNTTFPELMPYTVINILLIVETTYPERD
jgi:hypothetical protein